MEERRLSIHPIHPRAMWLLMHLFRAKYPKMTSEQVVTNAESVIEALQRGGFTVGPIAAFGPQDVPRPVPASRRDIFDGFDEVLGKMEEQRPWEIH